MNSLVRQLKLHGLVGEKASTDPRIASIIDFFDDLLVGMVVEVVPSYRINSIIFHKDGKFYMEEESGNGYLWCRDDGYWSVLRDDIGLGLVETQAVVKYMAEKHLKQQVGTPWLQWQECCTEVEKHLKQQVGTPRCSAGIATEEVEKHLKHSA